MENLRVGAIQPELDADAAGVGHFFQQVGRQNNCVAHGRPRYINLSADNFIAQGHNVGLVAGEIVVIEINLSSAFRLYVQHLLHDSGGRKEALLIVCEENMDAVAEITLKRAAPAGVHVKGRTMLAKTVTVNGHVVLEISGKE